MSNQRSRDALDDELARLRGADEALRESEERYRLLVELSPEPIVVHSGGLIVYMNAAGARVAGAASPAQMIGRSIMDFVHPDYREMVAEGVRQTQVERRPREAVEEKFVRLDGQAIDVEVAAIPITFMGRPATQVVFRDITDRKRAEAERRRLEEQLQQAQKMETVGTLAGGIAHDFNNLLAGMIGTLSVLDWQLDGGELPSSSEVREQLEVVRDCALRATEIVQQLLSLSRRAELRLSTVDLGQMVGDVVKMCRASFDPRVQIDILPSEDPALVEADPVRIKQVLLNLALNARDAMPEGGQLSFELRHLLHPSGSRRVRVSVRDSGRGIDSQHLGRIFDPFFTTKPVGKGTGLGLAMVYGIVTQHRGSVEVESQPTKGSVFHVELPASPHTALPSAIPLADLPRGSETVLVVDDEQVVRQLARGMLLMLGYNVLTASDGDEALHVLAESDAPWNAPLPGPAPARYPRIDLVLLDLIMPRKSGRETLQRIRAASRSLPVIVSSGVQLDAQALGMRGLGVSGLLAKPYELTDLAITVRLAIDGARSKETRP